MRLEADTRGGGAGGVVEVVMDPKSMGLIFGLVVGAVALIVFIIYLFRDYKFFMIFILIIFIGVNALLWSGTLDGLLGVVR